MTRYSLTAKRCRASIRRDPFVFLGLLGMAYAIGVATYVVLTVAWWGQDLFRDKAGSCAGWGFALVLGAWLGVWQARRLSGRHVELGVVPLGAAVAAVACMGLGLLGGTAPHSAALVRFLSHVPAVKWATAYALTPQAGLLFLLAFGGALFVVPLRRFIRFRCPPSCRLSVSVTAGSLIAVFAALATALWLASIGAGAITPMTGLLGAGLVTLALFVVTLFVLPDFLVRLVGIVITRWIYRIRTDGVDHVPLSGGALLVANHVSWVDAPLIAATQQRRIRFLMDRSIAESPAASWFFRLMGVIPIAPHDAPRRVIASLQEARAAIEAGYLVCIFAEGAVTRNGNVRGFRPGLERIVRGTEAPIIPVHIGGAWGSIFSYFSGRLLGSWPLAVPYPVSVIFGQALPSQSSSSAVRHAVLELSTRAAVLAKRPGHTLTHQFVRMARRHWFKPMATDSLGHRLTYGGLLTSALALARALRSHTSEQNKVGVVLPPSVGAVLVNVALTLLGKVPVNLNFTTTESALHSAVQQCAITTIVTSRAFLERMPKLLLPPTCVYIEDLRRGIAWPGKCVALLQALCLPVCWMGGGRMGPDEVATIIFSSGSTGEPKGVMLSHFNLLSNIDAFCQVFHFTAQDTMCAVLPFFHSFGFTITLWCPLVRGFGVSYHANPLEGERVAQMVRELRLSVLLATPTFLLAYLRRAERADFASLRLVMTGAEKLKTRVADAFEERFGIRPLEGYGATELSPVASINLPDVSVGSVPQVGRKEGSIGHPIPGVALKVVDPETGVCLPEGREGLLLAKGPNVMLGYLNRPQETQAVMRDGWYATGDVARMDEDGFVFLVDRLARYSKIAGEMVPHMAVEDKLTQALGALGQVVFVTAVPDEKKGEQLVVLYTREAGTVDVLRDIIRSSDLPNLWKPRRENFFEVDAIPVLGTGKVDLKRLKTLAATCVAQRGEAPVGTDAVREGTA